MNKLIVFLFIYYNIINLKIIIDWINYKISFFYIYNDVFIKYIYLFYFKLFFLKWFQFFWKIKFFWNLILKINIFWNSVFRFYLWRLNWTVKFTNVLYKEGLFFCEKHQDKNIQRFFLNIKIFKYFFLLFLMFQLLHQLIEKLI